MLPDTRLGLFQEGNNDRTRGGGRTEMKRLGDRHSNRWPVGVAGKCKSCRGRRDGEVRG